MGDEQMTKKEKDRIGRMDAAEVEGYVREFCLADVRLDEAQARLNEALAMARETAEPEIAALKEQRKEMFDVVRVWADAHPDAFAGRRSVAMVHGTLLYRKGQPTLKTLTGVTWEKVLGLLKQLRPEYVRRKEEVDRQAILADRDELKPTGLEALGLRVDQADRFDLEANKEKALQELNA